MKNFHASLFPSLLCCYENSLALLNKLCKKTLSFRYFTFDRKHSAKGIPQSIILWWRSFGEKKRLPYWILWQYIRKLLWLALSIGLQYVTILQRRDFKLIWKHIMEYFYALHGIRFAMFMRINLFSQNTSRWNCPLSSQREIWNIHNTNTNMHWLLVQHSMSYLHIWSISRSRIKICFHFPGQLVWEVLNIK